MMRLKYVLVFTVALLLALTPVLSVSALTWSATTVDSVGNVGQHTSIAYRTKSNGTLGGAHVCYYDSTNGDLKIARENLPGDEYLGARTIDFTGDVGRYCSIAVDSELTMHISYYDATNGNLKYYVQGAGEEFPPPPETVDSLGTVGLYTSIALDYSGRPHISYYRSDTGDLKYARKTTSGWSIETVDSAGTVGLYTSIVVSGSTPYMCPCGKPA
jgi:hypothetical protein